MTSYGLCVNERKIEGMVLRITLVLIVFGIAYLSLTPKETLTIGNDKISHFIAYGALMWNIGLLYFERRSAFIKGMALALCYGALIEVSQHFVPGRFMSLYDMFANAGGVLTGVLLTWMTYRPVHKVLRSAGII